MATGLVGRTGLARLLGTSENWTRELEKRGEIVPEEIIDGRPLFSIEKAVALRDRRAAQRSKGQKVA